MDDGGEIDLKFALEVHGIHRRAFSESESDHSSDFDEYEEYKPLPVEINSDNVIVIYPSDEENKSTDTNIKEGSQSVEDPTDQPIQNVINTAAIRKESLNPSTIQNDLNGNLPGIRPDFPNPNLQNFHQPIQNHYNPHAIKLVPVFPNFNNMQQFPQHVYNVPNPTIRIRPDFPYSNNMQQFQQPIQNYYNPHAVRVFPVFPNPNNMQQFPQNNSNPNSERIRQYFPNPSNMQQPQNDSNLNAERILISDFSNPSNMEQPQAVQNHSNPNSERIRTEFSNPSNVQQPQTVQNDYNPNAERIRTEFSNPSNVQQPQTVQNDSNPNAERIKTEFSNHSNMQQPQTVQNDSNPNSERIRPYFPNPINIQHPQIVQNDYNPNAERIRPYFTNPSSMQHFQNLNNLRAANFQHPIRMPQFYQTNQYIQNFNTGNSTAPILNNFLPNVTGMGYNPYQSNPPLPPMPVPPYGQPYLNHPPNQYWQHPNQFQGGTLIKNTPPNETKSNHFPKGIQMTPKTVDIMNMFGEEDYQAASKSKEEKTDICNAGDIVDNNSKIVVSVEELVKAFVVGNLLKKSMNISVVKRFKIDCIPSEISSKVREQFNIVISELEINTESIVYIELSSNINELLCVYHKECLLSICDTENDLNMSDDQSSRDDIISNLFNFYTTSSNTDEVEPTTITVSESSINFSTTVVQTRQIEGSYSQKFVSTTIKSVDDGLRKSTGTIPKKRKEKRAERARKFSKKGKTKKLDIVENPVIETYEEFPTQKLLLSVEEAIVECETDISKKNYEEICEEYVYEDIYGWNYLDRSLITELQCSTDYIDSIKHESDPLLNDIRDSTTGKNNIHLSTASIKLENKRIPKSPRSRWAYLRYSIMGCLISGLTRSMLSWIANNYIQICAFCLIWILKK